MTDTTSIVNVTITKATAQITRTGFGTPLLLVTHDVIPDLAKIYSSLSEMETDGFTSSDLAHKMATALLGQNPKISQFVLGKRVNQPTRLIRMTPVATPVADAVNAIEISSDDGTTDFEFTADSTPTVTEITAGLVAALNQDAWVTVTPYVVGDYVINSGNAYKCVTAGTSGATGPVGTGAGEIDGTVVWDFKGPEQNIVAVDNTTDLTIQSAATPGGVTQAGVPFGAVYDRSQMGMKDETIDAGIAADLAALRLVNDDWYAITGDWWDEATADALAAVIETLQKLHIWSNGDTDVLDAADATDVFSVMQGKAYDRSGGIWHSAPHTHPAAAWLGVMLAFDPGQATWMFKTLAGISFDTFTAGELTALSTKNANNYLRIGGQNMTQDGVIHGGASIYIDNVRSLDFAATRISEDVFAYLKPQPKVPYTDLGATGVQNVVDGRLQSMTFDGDGSGQIFSTDPQPVVTVPLVADVSAANKTARLLPDVNFTATFAGAIHRVDVNGVVSF